MYEHTIFEQSSDRFFRRSDDLIIRSEPYFGNSSFAAANTKKWSDESC